MSRKYPGLSRMRALGRSLRERMSQLAQRLSGRFREQIPANDEPIDFSAPSVPYYTGLADRFSLARVVLYMLLFVFAVVTVLSSRSLITYENLYYLVKDINAATLTAQSEADYLSYPVSDASAAFARFRGGLVVVGGDEITVLSGSGKQTLSENVSYSHPCVRAGEQYFLAFSRGEKNFSVYNAFVRVHKETTEFPVYDACMAANGAFAILTRSMSYTSEVIFYDEDMDVRAVSHIGGYVTSLSMSSDGKILAVTSVDVTDGAYVSKLTLLRRNGSSVDSHETILEGETAMASGFLADDRLCVVFDTCFRIYRPDGDEHSEVFFEGEAPLLCGMTNGYVAMLFESPSNLSENLLIMFDKNGREVYTISIDAVSDASQLVSDGTDVYIRTGDRVLRVSDGGRRLSEASIDRDTLTLLVNEDGDLLACTPAFAQQLDEADFTKIS